VKPHEAFAKGDQYVFVALASTSKAIISYRIGKRDVANTDDFVQDLRGRVLGSPEISTDGWKPYTLSVRDAFRNSAHGVIVKTELLAAGRQVFSELKNICVWVKHNAGMGSLYRSQHELVFVFKQGHGSHCNNVELGRFGRHRSNVWNYAGANTFGRGLEEGHLLTIHPTVKPVAMVADAILDCSARGDIILDPFLGSGTTLLAAERTGRRCCGIEIDPIYVDVVIRRWQAFTGEDARHAAKGQSFTEIETPRRRRYWRAKPSRLSYGKEK